MSMLRNCRILYVEDDRDLARLVQRHLQQAGCLVDLAYDGQEGLAKHAAGCYDVLVVDQTMPVCEGIEVIRILASRDRVPPTIMVTGTGNEEIAVEAMKLGASDYLVKDMVGGFLNLLPIVIEQALAKQHLVREKQHAEEQMAIFRRFVEASGQGFGMADLNRCITYLNPTLCRLIGVQRPEDALGKDFLTFFPTQQRQQFETEVIPAVVDKGQWVGESAVVTRAGVSTPVIMSLFLIRDEHGNPHYFATAVTDISQRKRMEGELAQAQKLEAIGHLAAGIAHEINTPTQYIGDNARFLQDAFGGLNQAVTSLRRLLEAAKEQAVTQELLAEVEAAVVEADVEYVTDEIPKAIQQSLDGVERVATIVRAMKDFSHPAGGQKQAVDLNRAIQSTLTISRNEWKYVAEMVTDFDPLLPPVRCLPSDFNQAILNLVVNAAQAIAKVVLERPGGKGTITVRTRRDGDWAEIRIEDNGTGVPEEIRSRVFDLFFTTKPVGEGTGQGLSIAQSIVVEKHGGTITFETETGRGTTFIIRLPINDASTPAHDPQPEAAEVAC